MARLIDRIHTLQFHRLTPHPQEWRIQGVRWTAVSSAELTDGSSP